MSALNKFKSTASLYALGAMMLANTSCDKSDAEPGTPGGNGGGNEQNTIVQDVPVGANQMANTLEYDATADIFKIKQTVKEGKATITFKIVDNKDIVGPVADTTGITSKGSALDPNTIDLNATTKGPTYTFIKYYNSRDDLPLNVAIPGKYIGDAPGIKEGNKTIVKKVPSANFSGVATFQIVNGTKTARENAEDVVAKIQKVKRGESKLQLIGQTANGYDGTFVYGSQSQPGTAFTIGKLSPK